jgi:hypothetical protein
VKRSLLAATAVLGFSSIAAAVEIEASGTAGIAPYTIGIALRDLAISDEIKLEFGITNRTASTGLSYATDFGPIGRLSSTLRFAYVFDPYRTEEPNKKLDPGFRVRLGARGTLASVGVEGNFAYWNVPADGSNPLSIFERDAEPISDSGWSLGAIVQYRLSRVLVLSGGTKYATDGGSRLNLKLEGREADSEFTYSGGILIGFQEVDTNYLGELGLKYSPIDQPYSINIGAQLGLTNNNKDGDQNSSKFDYGFSFGIDTDLPDELGKVSAFGVWEPWRLDVYSIRYGLSTEFNLGGGMLFARALGGSLGGGLYPWAVQLGFRLPLDDLLNPPQP